VMLRVEGRERTGTQPAGRECRAQAVMQCVTGAGALRREPWTEDQITCARQSCSTRVHGSRRS
jgi:hypothetical protein